MLITIDTQLLHDIHIFLVLSNFVASFKAMVRHFHLLIQLCEVLLMHFLISTLSYQALFVFVYYFQFWEVILVK